MVENVIREPALSAASVTVSGRNGVEVCAHDNRSIMRLEWSANSDVDANLETLIGAPVGSVGTAAGGDDLSLLRIGPQSAWVACDTLDPLELAGRLQDFCRSHAVSIVDISDGMTALRCGGSSARSVLQAGVPADLHETMLPPQRLARSVMDHHPVTIHCLEDQLFDIYVERSLVESFWERLALRITAADSV